MTAVIGMPTVRATHPVVGAPLARPRMPAPPSPRAALHAARETAPLDHDLGGITLPLYQRGLPRYTITQWERLAHEGMSWAPAGQRLLADAQQRLQALAPGRLANGSPALPWDVCRELLGRFIDREGGGHLFVRLTQVQEDVPREHTFDNAVHGIQASWLPFRAAWDAVVDGLADPLTWSDAQHAAHRLVDLTWGTRFLALVWREMHGVDPRRIAPTWRHEELRERHDANDWRARIDAHVAAEDARIDRYLDTHQRAIREAGAALRACEGDPPTAPHRILERIIATLEARGWTVAYRRDRSGVQVHVLGAVLFSGPRCSDVLREIRHRAGS